MASADPIIAWDNKIHASASTLAADSETASDLTGPVNNLTNWKTFSRWKSDEGPGFAQMDFRVDLGSNIAITSFGLAGHNLNTVGAEITLQYSNDNFAADINDAVAASSPSDDEAFLKTFSSISERYWRVLVSAGYTADIEVGVWHIGPHLTMPELPESGFNPDAQDTDTQSELSRNGHLLGSVQRFRMRKISVQFKFLTDAFIQNTFKPAWENYFSTGEPFFWVWDITNHSDEVYLVRISTPSLNVPFNEFWRNLSFDMTGVAE